MAAGSHIILDHPRSVIVRPSSALNFRINRIHSFGDMAIFAFRRFGLKSPTYVVVSAADAQNSTSDVGTTQIFGLLVIRIPKIWLIE